MAEFLSRWHSKFSDHYLANTNDVFHPFVKAYCRNLIESGHSKEAIPDPTFLSPRQIIDLEPFGSQVYELLLACDMLAFSAERSLHLYAGHMLGAASEHCEEVASLAKVNCSLTTYVLTYFSTAVDQALRGNELVVRTLVRSISEASDLLLACQFDANLRTEFIEAGEDFKPFWWKYMRNESLINLRKNLLRERFEFSEQGVQEDEEYHRAEYDHFSQITHPSYDAGIIGFMLAGFGSNLLDDDVDKVWASRRSLTFAVSKAFVPVGNALAFARDNAAVRAEGSSFWPGSRDAIQAHLGGAMAAGLIVSIVSNQFVK